MDRSEINRRGWQTRRKNAAVRGAVRAAWMEERYTELDALRAEVKRLSEVNAHLRLSNENLRSLLAQSPAQDCP